MIKIPTTLSFRMTLWYTSAFVFFISIAFIVLYISIDGILDTRIDNDLFEDIVDFRQLYKNEGVDRVKREINYEVSSDDNNSTFLRLLDRQGNQKFTSDLSAWGMVETDKEAINRISQGFGPVLQSTRYDNQVFSTRVVYGVIAPDTILHVGESLEEKEELLELLLSVFTGMFFVVIPLASVIGWIMARKAVKGIEEISNTAADIEAGQLHKRVVIKAKEDEILLLADTFNAMLDRIRKLITEMREMSDNIAHDLRSPLGRIRAISELSLSAERTVAEHQAAASNTIEECDRLLQMINATMDVAEAEAGISDAVNEQIEIVKIVNDAYELFEPVAEEKQIALTCVLGKACQTYGNVQYLQRMVANLIDNALKYTPAKGSVNIELLCTEKSITIVVSDTGVGIPETDQARIFDRFYRCDQSRTEDGCGMGLSFSQAVAQAHGGQISVVSESGVGASFTVTLPVFNLPK